MNKLHPFLIGLALIFGGIGQVDAELISIKLTSNALGLGTSDINYGKTVDADMDGFITSSVTGEGSILSILTNKKAGTASAMDPLFVTVTAKQHLDTINGLPTTPHDYKAGILSISKEHSETPDGRKEGLGVRAFTVDDTTAKREFDAATGRAKIEGSKHVSGGTGPDTYDSSSPNGSPHVDESVTFNFNPVFNVNAQSIEVLLSDFKPTDIIDLHIDRVSKFDLDFTFLGDFNSTGIFEEVENIGDGYKLFKLKFSGISGLSSDDLVNSFSIRANDDNPLLDPKGTAEHFFITGLTADFSPVPEPSSLALLSMGVCGLFGYGFRRKRKVAGNCV